MPIDKFHPARIESDDTDYDRLGTSWVEQGKPRKFVFMGIQWIQITDGDKGIVFVPTENEQTINSGYGQSSYQRVLKS